MKALEDTEVPVPRMIALENEGTVLGTRFYVMEKIEVGSSPIFSFPTFRRTIGERYTSTSLPCSPSCTG